MKKIALTFCAASLVFFACNDAAKTEETKTSKDSTMAVKPKPMSAEEQQKAWMAYMTPGEVHKMMAASHGQWNEDVTMWMAPDSPAVKSKATAVNKMIMGGRYQQSISTGNMMGMPFEGMSIVGYDNNKKVFVSTWVDNFGTGIMNMEGPWDDKTKSMTLTGKMVDPMGGGKEVDVKEVMTFVNDKTQKMEMYMTTDGKMWKTMEIMFTKK